MGKKKVGSSSQNLGKTIIKDRFSRRRPQRSADSFLHTSELNDGYDWGRLNLQSVTEQNQLDDFLMTAELAGTEFTAEKLNIQVVNEMTSGLPTALDIKTISDAQEQHKSRLRIPRRPAWHGGMTSEELQALERQHFLEWRKDLAALQNEEHIIVTPFERNLEFWRQLWRVIERSDVVVQIVDARDPLLFRCEDLETYVQEVDKNKVNVILVNKSDFLTEKQRQHWADYFTTQSMKVFFWSALVEAEKLQSESRISDGVEEVEGHNSDNEVSSSSDESESVEDEPSSITDSTDMITDSHPAADSSATAYNTSTLYGATDLIEQIRLLAPTRLVQEDVLTIGLVGYPNVGKSSSINAILQAKKCPVSATPGRTKHFQTVYLDEKTMLCDCPGLVMPSFVSSKAEMIASGILPIDQMRDHKPAVHLIAQRLGRDILERTYGITIRRPKEGEDPHRPPTDLEVLNAYGAMRGFMTSSGVPDCPRSARILLKDYVKGKLLYCEAPPGVTGDDFKPVCQNRKSVITQATNSATLDEVTLDNLDIDTSISQSLDSNFFAKKNSQIHMNGVTAGQPGKSWKKHGNRHKKEKTRRLFRHLDEHSAY